METRRIGSLEVSAVGLGCNNFGKRLDAAATAAVVDAALDAGITLFDTADMYGGGRSEEYLGRALAGRRERAVIATKFGWKLDETRQGASAAYVKRAVEDSLKRLGTDRIDLYQLHKPDPATPIAETLGALADLVREGKVREIGCSNFSAAQLDEAERAAAGGPRFVSVQNEYSLLRRGAEEEVLPACERLGLAFLPYFPLASGLLTGKYRRGRPLPAGTRLSEPGRTIDEKDLEVVERLLAFAGDRGHTILDLAFAYLLSRREVASVIAGATSVDQVRANVAAAGWTLSADDLAALGPLLRDAGA